MTFDKKKIIGGVLGVVIGFAFPLGCMAAGGIAGLSTQALLTLGILLWAIVWWVFSVLPEFATGLIMAALFIVVAGVNSQTVFSAFATSTWWLLMSAFALGLGMKSCGLMRRMALAIVRVFPATFRSQTLALFAAGTLLGPFIPSTTAKCAMLTPLAFDMGKALGFKPQDKQMTGLFASSFVGVRNVSLLIISASVTGYAMLATLPSDVQASFDILHWALAAAVWFIVSTVLNYLLVQLLYGKRGSKRGSAANEPGDASADASADSDAAANKIADEKPGPMTLHEKQMCVIAVAALVLWATEPLHHIASFIVGLVAVVAMVACGIVTRQTFKSGVAWDSLVFIGLTLGLAPVFSEVGLNDWIVATCGPIVQQFAANPFVLVLGAAIITLIIRFLIVSEITYLNLFMAFAAPIAISMGVSPWVIAFAAYTADVVWFGMYQNPTYMAAFYSVDGQMVKHGSMSLYCLFYHLIGLVALAASVPYWQLLGLL